MKKITSNSEIVLPENIVNSLTELKMQGGKFIFVKVRGIEGGLVVVDANKKIQGKR